jgi:2-polyprenyl-6-methoxyphenol hydroxylase-like FAD-dependent oxidoreductase
MSNHIQAPRKAIVCGAGPVGCLAAMALAQMGWHVDIYEGRDGKRPPQLLGSARLSLLCPPCHECQCGEYNH